jgi:hypothetical protein
VVYFSEQINMGYFLIGVVILIIMNMLLNWICLDLLIEIESQKFQLNWSNDGKPVGMFNKRTLSTLFGGGSFRRNSLLSKWLFHKPVWITKDEKASKIYKVFRLTGFTQVFSIVSVIVFFIVIFFYQP